MLFRFPDTFIEIYPKLCISFTTETFIKQRLITQITNNADIISNAFIYIYNYLSSLLHNTHSYMVTNIDIKVLCHIIKSNVRKIPI